ncbi:hypothetical protein [Planctomicrobium sp. SH664]|uniref:hypothetical protein n=1 Tax=Planctomicrobium sp. SH664 TaxID=3448125 RepID=UPI003F5C5C9A
MILSTIEERRRRAFAKVLFADVLRSVTIAGGEIAMERGPFFAIQQPLQQTGFSWITLLPMI